ncbi:SOS response transcriptional repressor, RecA-mediated autopeptidase [Brevibacillus sp. CF112]|uniref:helix-turn-helix domain-containing protein n=1 Tax=Brevibacillus TaxID=55080 RepID=UPI000271A2BF|nr:LexA family transcriptional regulator [Brevibacillus sp. CF112]EJL38973.1 SOS response transcriptional repressor, RecA-mediated autopeptidase [Brevibacillus sp. CF112]
MNTIAERIEYLIEKKGLSKNQFAKEVGISTGNLGDWKRGKSMPGANALIAISSFFDVSLDWLMTGKERPTPKTEPEASAVFFDTKREVVSQFDRLIKSLDEKDRAFVDRYIELATFHKQYAAATSETIPQPSPSNKVSKMEQIKESSSEYSEELTHPVPLVGKTAAGSEKTYYEYIRGYVPIPKSVIKGTCFVMEVDGDSMTGDGIQDGDFIVVKQQPDVIDGSDIALLRINDDEVTLKRIFREKGRVVLLSSNPTHPKRSVPAENVQIVGKYIYKIPGDIGRSIIREELF